MIGPKEGRWQRRVEQYSAEVGAKYGRENQLFHEETFSVAVEGQGRVYVATGGGLACLDQGTFHSVIGLDGSPILVASGSQGTMAATSRSLFRIDGLQGSRIASMPGALRKRGALRSLATGSRVLLGSAVGLHEWTGGKIVAIRELRKLLGEDRDVRQVALGQDGAVAVAAMRGLFIQRPGQGWEGLFPHDAQGRSWAPRDVRGVTFDGGGRLWFASPQGVGCLRGDAWELYTGVDGLPFDDFTLAASGETEVVWFGTSMGAIRFDGQNWAYRQGPRWFPEDRILSIGIGPDQTAWFATQAGLASIERRKTTFSSTALFFENEVDRVHRRTHYGFVDHVGLSGPGDTSVVIQSDSDNDGLWTSMYGAGECFAYGATKDPKAKARAKAAFDAMNFLREVTQGGTHPAPPGFVARTVLPTCGPDPNEGRIEGDRRHKERDALWKIIDPRWPISEDGQWYWKTDTSSDELDGHFFLYGLYHDLVAETEEERARVRRHVGAIADHLIDHDFQLVDHDGLPTRWARFSPREFNFDKDWWEGRGLNSLSILAYLSTAEHICGSGRYQEAVERLVHEHGYAMNLMYPKAQFGQGSGNQSDDEMAFMNYYNLVKYARDEELRRIACKSLSLYWGYIRPNLNPFFNFIYAVCCTGEFFKDTWRTEDLTPRSEEWLDESIDSLKRILLDRVAWPLRNSHRKDIVLLPEYARWDRSRLRGLRRCGKVLPMDEQHVDHWNHDCWTLDFGGDGRRLADGAVFLLPYYMGLYYGFIVE